LTQVFIPQLAGVNFEGKRFSGNLTFNKHAVPQLKAGFEAIERAGLLSHILTFDGSFNPRVIHGTNKISRHTYGIAFDINAEYNPFHRPPAPPGQKGSLYEVAKVLENFGFAWGGNFRNPDGMHFEVGKLLMPKEVDEALKQYNEEKVELFVNGEKKDVFITIWGDISYSRIGDLMAAIGKKPMPNVSTLQIVPIREFFKANGFDVYFRSEGGSDGAGPVKRIEAYSHQSIGSGAKNSKTQQ